MDYQVMIVEVNGLTFAPEVSRVLAINSRPGSTQSATGELDSAIEAFPKEGVHEALMNVKVIAEEGLQQPLSKGKKTTQITLH
jgi:hypothetical protein